MSASPFLQSGVLFQGSSGTRTELRQENRTQAFIDVFIFHKTRLKNIVVRKEYGLSVQKSKAPGLA
jgi:hypothetical protein